jgi:hypothetical protein
MKSFIYKDLLRLRHCKRFYTEKQINDATENPVIIHLTNSFYVKGRAWVKGNGHPYSYIYQRYKALTPWKDEQLFNDNTPLPKALLGSLIRILPQSIICSIVGFVYNIWRPYSISKKSSIKA